jgi:hypothetical protein
VFSGLGSKGETYKQCSGKAWHGFQGAVRCLDWPCSWAQLAVVAVAAMWTISGLDLHLIRQWFMRGRSCDAPCRVTLKVQIALGPVAMAVQVTAVGRSGLGPCSSPQLKLGTTNGISGCYNEVSDARSRQENHDTTMHSINTATYVPPTECNCCRAIF